MFKFICSGFKKTCCYFQKNVQILFVFWKFVRCFKICSWFLKNVRVFKFVQIFRKVFEFRICSNFSKKNRKLFTFFIFPVSFYSFFVLLFILFKNFVHIFHFFVLFFKIWSDFLKNVLEFQKIFARSNFCSQTIPFSKFCSQFKIFSRFKSALV